MIVVHAKIPVDPNKRSEALELFEELIEKSQKENGMVNYHGAFDIQNSNIIRFFEQYEDKEAMEAHTQSDHFKKFKEKLSNFVDGEPKAIMFEVAKSTELDL